MVEVLMKIMLMGGIVGRVMKELGMVVKIEIM